MREYKVANSEEIYTYFETKIAKYALNGVCFYVCLCVCRSVCLYVWSVGMIKRCSNDVPSADQVV